MQTPSEHYKDRSFATRRDMADALAARVLTLIAERPNAHLLDLGCGTGGIAIKVAVSRGDLRVTALDISAPNVEAARRAVEESGVGPQISVACADYVASSPGRFDAIVSDSVLHLLKIDDRSLALRLAENLEPGGVLLVTIPLNSVDNSVRILGRRAWGAMPAIFDRWALGLARLIYPRFAPEALAERIPYLRILPYRLHGEALDRVFAGAGLYKIIDEAWPSPSLAKLRHRLVGWRRAESRS
jgi:trans-aconitate 2-methyltransferase